MHSAFKRLRATLEADPEALFDNIVDYEEVPFIAVPNDISILTTEVGEA